MTQHQTIFFLRLPEICAKHGKCKSSVYNEISAGLFPPPIKISTRSSAWPGHEVEAITKARIAGASEKELKALVLKLVAQRKTEAV